MSGSTPLHKYNKTWHSCAATRIHILVCNPFTQTSRTHTALAVEHSVCICHGHGHTSASSLSAIIATQHDSLLLSRKSEMIGSKKGKRKLSKQFLHPSRAEAPDIISMSSVVMDAWRVLDTENETISLSSQSCWASCYSKCMHFQLDMLIHNMLA